MYANGCTLLFEATCSLKWKKHVLLQSSTKPDLGQASNIHVTCEAQGQPNKREQVCSDRTSGNLSFVHKQYAGNYAVYLHWFQLWITPERNFFQNCKIWPLLIVIFCMGSIWNLICFLRPHTVTSSSETGVRAGAIGPSGTTEPWHGHSGAGETSEISKIIWSYHVYLQCISRPIGATYCYMTLHCTQLGTLVSKERITWRANCNPSQRKPSIEYDHSIYMHITAYQIIRHVSLPDLNIELQTTKSTYSTVWLYIIWIPHIAQNVKPTWIWHPIIFLPGMMHRSNGTMNSFES